MCHQRRAVSAQLPHVPRQRLLSTPRVATPEYFADEVGKGVMGYSCNYVEITEKFIKNAHRDLLSVFAWTVWTEDERKYVAWFFLWGMNWWMVPFGCVWVYSVWKEHFCCCCCLNNIISKNRLTVSVTLRSYFEEESMESLQTILNSQNGSLWIWEVTLYLTKSNKTIIDNLSFAVICSFNRFYVLWIEWGI